ncbi:SDR family NAD(P)-dependent oxidoreductase [Paraburkholderia caribensis]|uniref:SDR family NAD(P)-dependent oxidoreductase n=1 Tax=Paraburkholderia caribensis TaxID=75105 RepID=UPI0034D36673
MTKDNSKGTAIITGASSGIGLAYAAKLAQRGYDLILVARRKDRLDIEAKRLSDTHNRQVTTISADLTKPADLRQIEELLSTRGDVSLLVNNAGVGAIGSLLDVSVDAMDDLIKINVVALTRLSHAAVTAFSHQKRGTIINIGSIIAFKPANTAAAYAGSKSYVLSFSRSLQSQLKDSGITVQVVLPGPVRTEFFTASGVSPSIFPDAHFATAEEIVEAALLGLDRNEQICIPSLSDVGDWDAYDAAQRRLAEVISDGHPSGRYGTS